MAYRDETEMVRVEQSTVYMICDRCGEDIGEVTSDLEYWTVEIRPMRRLGDHGYPRARGQFCESCARALAATLETPLPVEATA